MTHRKLTLFGAQKRPPKSRSNLSYHLIEFEFRKKKFKRPKSQPHRHQHQHQQHLHPATKRCSTNQLFAPIALIVAIIALVHIKYCTGTRFINSADDENSSSNSNNDNDTQDKFSEMSATEAAATSDQHLSRETNNTSNNLSSSSSVVSALSEDSMKFPLYMRIIATLFCLLIFSVGVCGNLLVPLVVIKTKYLRNSTNLFLINLSIADLLVLIVCMPTVLIELHSRPETWLLGEPMCK